MSARRGSSSRELLHPGVPLQSAMGLVQDDGGWAAARRLNAVPDFTGVDILHSLSALLRQARRGAVLWAARYERLQRERAAVLAPLIAAVTDAPPATTGTAPATAPPPVVRRRSASQLAFFVANIGYVDLRDESKGGMDADTALAADALAENEDDLEGQAAAEAGTLIRWGAGPKLADAIDLARARHVGFFALVELQYRNTRAMSNKQRMGHVETLLSHAGFDCRISPGTHHDTGAGVLIAWHRERVGLPALPPALLLPPPCPPPSHACLHVRVYVCMLACLHACTQRMHVCLYVCMSACLYVCTHVCLHVCTHVRSSPVLLEGEGEGEG